jgi:hypothetical protein
MAKPSRLERSFQASLIRELKKRFSGCIVTKLDSSHIQGIPDLLILWGKHWATLEVKRSARAHRQPNQEHYVNLMNDMSFSRFIFPENKEEVLNELERSFGTGRKSCISVTEQVPLDQL